MIPGGMTHKGNLNQLVVIAIVVALIVAGCSSGMASVLPMDKGLQDDNGLPNEAGKKLIADLFRKLGYEYIIP
jgi:hypothetical protein